MCYILTHYAKAKMQDDHIREHYKQRRFALDW